MLKNSNFQWMLEFFNGLYYFKLPGTDFDNLPELEAFCGETAGLKIRIYFNSFLRTLLLPN